MRLPLRMPALVLCVGNPKNRKEGNVIGYSGCIDHLVQVDSAEEGISWIKEHMADFPDNTVIYPTSDSEEQALDRTQGIGAKVRVSQLWKYQPGERVDG